MNPPTEADEMLNPAPEYSDLTGIDEVFEDILMRFTWDIENFSRLKDKYLVSNPYFGGGYKWQLFVFPKGNNVDHLSVYIQAVDAVNMPFGCCIYTMLSLAVVNQVSYSFSVRKATQHEFNSRKTNCGFTWLMKLSELYDCGRGFLVNDKCVIEADVMVRLSQRSKFETGYVGLKSLGATRYLNSLLQTLYHIPYLKKAVFHMPINWSDEGSIPLALQSLFYILQYSETSVATEDLIGSFGLDTYEYFKKHSVNELSMALFEKLEEKMKGTVVEGAIQQLFEGHTINYVFYTNQEIISTREETFSYLQLDVKGCRNVYESFDKYVKIERLEADINRHHSEPYGVQGPMKRAVFIDFPPVLILELKRFEYDCKRDPMLEKINDRYEFPLQLDLDREDQKYLFPGSDINVRNLYTLYSVWVHRPRWGVEDGHYFTYIRPTLSDQWLKFDDERVIGVDMKRAVYEQYGDEEGHQTNSSDNNSSLNFTNFSNAYMLVYIRESEKAKIFCDVDEKDMAEHLQVRLEEDELHFCTTIKLVREKDFHEQIGKQIYLDLVDFDKICGIRVRKHTSFSLFQEKVAKQLGIPVQYQQYWLWKKRHNIRTYRPYRPLTLQEKANTVEYIRKFSNKYKNAELHLYLEIGPGQDVLPFGISPPEKRILLFFKLYDPVKQKLSYIVHLVVKGTDMLADILSTLYRLVGFGPSDEVDLFVEMSCKPYVVCLPLDKMLSFEENYLGDGDIICFQKVVDVEIRKRLPFPDVPSFMKHIWFLQTNCNRTLGVDKQL